MYRLKPVCPYLKLENVIKEYFKKSQIFKYFASGRKKSTCMGYIKRCKKNPADIPAGWVKSAVVPGVSPEGAGSFMRRQLTG